MRPIKSTSLVSVRRRQDPGDEDDMILHKYVGQIIDKRVDESGHQPKFDPDDEDDMILTFLPRANDQTYSTGIYW